MDLWSVIAAVFSLVLGNPSATEGPSPLSHLDAHLSARPPEALARPLGGEGPGEVLKGLDEARERPLADALLALGLHSRLLKVGVASNGSVTAALVKLQVGDRQSGLVSLGDLESDAARAVQTTFGVLPEVEYLDVWATVPGEREFEEFHRPVFALSVGRRQLAGCLGPSATPRELLAACGCVRVDPLLHRYAIDGPGSAKVHQASGEVLEAPTLADRWTEFGAQAKASGEIDPVPVAGPVGAIVEGDPAGGVVALTIDDGPHPLTTPLTLETLRREGVKATFFLVGEKVEQYPELTRMIARDGHEIGNHTYSHIGLSQLNPRGIWTQLRGCERVLQQAVGVTPTLFRPPGGDCSELSLRVTSRLGYPTVLWTANAGDWARESREAIVANGLSHVRSGSIILIHQGDMWSLEALPYIIQGVRSAALRIGTVTEALGGAGPTQWEPSELLPLAKQAHTDRW